MGKSPLFRLWRESSHYTLAKNFLLVGFFVLLGKGIGGAKEIAVAWRYGVSPIVDSYVLIFNVVNWPGAILAGVLTTAMVPLGTILFQRSVAEARIFFSEALGWMLFVAFVLLGGVYGLLSYAIDSGWLGLGSEEAKLAKDMYVPLLSTLFFSCLIAFFSPWILIAGKHWNTFSEMIPSACIFLALVFFSFFFNPLVWGTVVGFFLQCILLIFCLSFLNLPLRPRWSFSSPEWGPFARTLLPLFIIQILMILPGVVDQIWVAHLESGAISVFNYTNRLFSLLSSLAMVVIVRSALPVLAQRVNDPFVFRFVKQWMFIVFIFGLLLSCLCLLYSYDIVRIFFERGAFTVGDSEKVTHVFRYSICSVPFYFAFILGGQIFFILKMYIPLIFVYTAILVAKIIGNFFLVQSFSISAFMISGIIMYVCGVLFLICYFCVFFKDVK